MFSDRSRYRNAETYTVTDSRGRNVQVVAAPRAPLAKLAGYHLLLNGQRMDHLAYKYLGDAAAYWRIGELNGVMLAETLTEQPEIAIPAKS
jgi:hypothetical protein